MQAALCGSLLKSFSVPPKNLNQALMFLKARGMELEGNISNLSASVSSTTVPKKGKRSKKQGASHEEGNNRGSGCNVECSRKEGLDSVQSITKEDVVKTHAQFQNVGSHSTTLETLTVQELRGMMREVGIPIRGTKRDLLSALKSFLDNQAEGRLSGQTSDALGLATISSAASMKTVSQKSTSSKRKVGHSSAGENQPVSLVSLDHVQNLGTVSEASGTLKKKSRGKPQILESANCNDTTASKAKKKMMAKFTNEDAGLVEGDGLSMTRSEPWTVLAHKKPQHGWVPYNPSTMRASPLADDVKTMKLMSWNVNGLRALLKLEGFSAVQLAQRENFDILCLQETKLQEKDVEDIKQCLISGYDDSFWSCSVSKLGYSGTAVISRIKPLSVRYGLGILDHDTEGRLITVEFDAFYLLSGYVPNSGDGLIRLTYRTKEWDPALGNYMKDLEKSKPVILTGDLNCAHQEIDIYNPAGNRRSAGFTDEERESFETNFLSRGFVDTFRRQHPCAIGYTYWGYRHGARKTNRGWRLDYFLASESIADQVHDSYILPDVVGSDHCPIGLTVKL